MEWEKIFTNAATDRGLIKNIQMAHTSQYQKNQTTQSKKWAEDLNRHFSKEDIEMAIRHMKRCSKSITIRKMQIKTTTWYYLTLV